MPSCDNFKIPSYTDCLEDAEIRVTLCLPIFDGITYIITKILRVYMVLGSCLKIRDVCIDFDPLIRLTWFLFTRHQTCQIANFGLIVFVVNLVYRVAKI